jgi:Zn finger protein HypA/HybF involved in hydrogenase expression
MKCPHCKKEMLETRLNVFYCQSKNCKIAYTILTGAKVRVQDIEIPSGFSPNMMSVECLKRR